MCPTELDALGDEFLMDDDSSYLDEASSAPSIPEGLPGDKSTNRVLHRFRTFIWLKLFITAIINYWGFSLMATLLLVFSGWCSGWRVRPSSDSCYIKERSKHSLKFYMYHSLFSIYPTDTPSLRVRIFIIRAAMINRFISLKIISNYLDDQLILSVSFFK